MQFVRHFAPDCMTRTFVVLVSLGFHVTTSATEITSSPADDTEPAWSPDGKRIAFSSFRDGNRDIYLIDADGTNETRLTTDPVIDTYPRWTPDGRILFNRIRDGLHDMYMMNDDGSNLTLLKKLEARRPACSPDGKSIAFMSPSVEIINESFPRQLFVGDADGSNLRMLTSNPGNASEPCWSPDGARIVFALAVDKVGARLNLFQVDLDGRNVKRLTAGPAMDRRPSLSPDGSRLAFRATARAIMRST